MADEPIKTRSFERLTLAVPVNNDAARTMRRGTHWQPKNKINGAHFTTVAPPTQPVPAGTEDLTGRKFGRFTVKGYFASKRWAVRCACGNFEIRSSKAVRNPDNVLDACNSCRHLLFLQRESYYRRNGKDLTREQMVKMFL